MMMWSIRLTLQAAAARVWAWLTRRAAVRRAGDLINAAPAARAPGDDGPQIALTVPDTPAGRAFMGRLGAALDEARSHEPHSVPRTFRRVSIRVYKGPMGDA